MKGISRSSIKWVAMAVMFIDHLRFTLVQGSTMKAAIIRTCLFGVGRLAFPLFAYLLVDGFFRTRSKEKFFIRLFIFAILSEVPYDLLRSHRLSDFSGQNVLWTLLFGFGAMWGTEIIRTVVKDEKKKNLRILLQALVSLCYIVAGYFAHSDYGYIGVTSILIMYFCKIYGETFPKGFPVRGDFLGFVAGTLILLVNNEMEITALAGAFLIWNYYGKPGKRIPMVIGYGFYPLHMLILVTVAGLIYPGLNIMSMLHL